MDQKESIIVQFMSFDKSTPQPQLPPSQLLQSRPKPLQHSQLLPLSQPLPKPLPKQRERKFPPDHKISTRAPGFIPIGDKRIDQFWSLSDKVQKQLLQIEKWTSLWSANIYLPVLLQIFDEFYNLAQLNRNDTDLEELQVECLRQIIGNTTSLSYNEKKTFMILLQAL